LRHALLCRSPSRNCRLATDGIFLQQDHDPLLVRSRCSRWSCPSISLLLSCFQILGDRNARQLLARQRSSFVLVSCAISIAKMDSFMTMQRCIVSETWVVAHTRSARSARQGPAPARIWYMGSMIEYTESCLGHVACLGPICDSVTQQDQARRSGQVNTKPPVQSTPTKFY
jgi:hypothetical protein